MVIKVLNLDKCIKKFGDIGKIDVMPEIKEGARKVQRTARDIVPVDTGFLKGSIHVLDYPKQLTSVVYTVTEYGPHVEFGTVKMVAQPYMIPAMNDNRAGIVSSMKKYLREQLAVKARS